MEDLEKYKWQILPVGIFIMSVFVIFQFLYPQILSISETQQKIADAQTDIEALNNQIEAIDRIQNPPLDQQLSLVNEAYLSQKDIVAIYSGIITAAVKADIVIDQFSIHVGDVYRKEENNSGPVQQNTVAPAANSSGDMNVTVDLQVTGDGTKSIASFPTQLYTVLPLSEVTNFSAAGKKGSFEVSFYYKPIDIRSLASRQFISPGGVNQQRLLDTLKQWQGAMTVASPSAFQ